MFKCAIIGVGGKRAYGHAEAYQHLRRGRLVAVSTRRRDKLDAFGDDLGIAARYTDYQEMLFRVKPDLVHVNTPPTVRREILEAAAEAGVAALIFEKPLALQGEDYLDLCKLAESTPVKVAVNHQLHFHRRRQIFQDLVAQGELGEIRLVEASARLNLAYQGTHSLQALAAFHPHTRPASVLAQVAGAEGLGENPRQLLAPDRCIATVRYGDGSTGLLQCGENAPRVSDGRRYQNKRVAVYGTHGFLHWTMYSWEMCRDGVFSSGEHDYRQEDVLGQAAMTDAMFDWLGDDGKVHPLHLRSELLTFNVFLGIYTSALRRSEVSLPLTPEPHLIDALRQVLGRSHEESLAAGIEA